MKTIWRNEQGIDITIPPDMGDGSQVITGDFIEFNPHGSWKVTSRSWRLVPEGPRAKNKQRILVIYLRQFIT